MKKAKLINNNDLIEGELWQLLLDALMIHFKDHDAKMLEVSDTSFTALTGHLDHIQPIRLQLTYKTIQ
jgi:hypothetical protein